MRYTIWYHLYNLKNVKNTHGGVSILVKLQTEAKIKGKAETKINTPPWVLITFFKLYKWYQIVQRTTSSILFNSHILIAICTSFFVLNQ